MTRLEQYDKFAKEARDLFIKKNMEYGDSIKECGFLGAAIELVAIAARLKQLVIKSLNYPIVAETHDKFLDATNYGIVGNILLEEKNWRGE